LPIVVHSPLYLPLRSELDNSKIVGKVRARRHAGGAGPWPVPSGPGCHIKKKNSTADARAPLSDLLASRCPCFGYLVSAAGVCSLLLSLAATCSLVAPPQLFVGHVVELVGAHRGPLSIIEVARYSARTISLLVPLLVLCRARPRCSPR
jgi:hypothetical protein